MIFFSLPEYENSERRDGIEVENFWRAIHSKSVLFSHFSEGRKLYLLWSRKWKKLRKLWIN
jgi:hypothetical protein